MRVSIREPNILFLKYMSVRLVVLSSLISAAPISILMWNYGSHALRYIDDKLSLIEFKAYLHIQGLQSFSSHILTVCNVTCTCDITGSYVRYGQHDIDEKHRVQIV